MDSSLIPLIVLLLRSQSGTAMSKPSHRPSHAISEYITARRTALSGEAKLPPETVGVCGSYRVRMVANASTHLLSPD